MRVSWTLAALLGLLLAIAPTAAADLGDNFGVKPGSFWAGTCQLPAVTGTETTPDEAREKRDCHRESALAPQTAQPITQAGAHPDATSTFELEPIAAGPGRQGPYPDGNVKDIVLDLPRGLLGDPEAVPKCAQGLWALGRCPVETQVGIVELRLSSQTSTNQNPQACNPAQPNPTTYPQFSMPGETRCRFPINNLEPGFGETAAFGFNFYTSITVYFRPIVRTDGDYGVQLVLRNVPELPAVSLVTATLWGIPGDPSHDGFRYRRTGIAQHHLDPPQPWPPSVPVKPFLSNPTACDGKQPVTTLKMRSWQKPDAWKAYETKAPPVTGCGQVPFEPTIDVKPGTPQADAASALDVDMRIPQNVTPPAAVAGDPAAAAAHWRSPAGRATAHLDKAVVQLPEGVSVNPSGATGLEGCSDAQLALRSNAEPTCPDGSKIGTVDIFSPLLPTPDGPGTPNLKGDVFLGAPKSTDPQSGQMFRLALVVRNAARGLLVKIPGSAVADPRTGRLTATFDDNPQLPFETLSLKLKGGPRSLLAMPRRCGNYAWTAELAPWTADAGGGGAVKRGGGAVAIGGDCSNRFTPALRAGMDNQQAGGSGAFSFTFSRQDGEQYLSSLSAQLPLGLLARVRDVPLCPNAAANAGTCPPESRIGSADAGAGSGQPFFLERKGDVYLTEGYKGAPYGLSVKVPVEAGPFRGAYALRTIVVRQALRVDPISAQITAVSDPFPEVWHGIPLRIRQVTVTVDRPGFMVNPTSCAQQRILGTFSSTEGAQATASTPFQARNCAALPFRPRLSLTLTNRRQTTDGKHPGLTAVVAQRPGEAGIKGVQVTLPLSLALDPDNARALCEYADGLKVNCPETSVIGTATAVSPLLRYPLRGKVYFVKGVRFNSKGAPIRTLPTLLIPLRGEIALDLRASSDVNGKQQLVNTFNAVPDAPISRFELKLQGGRHGILAVTHDENICVKTQVAEIDTDGHNGKRLDGDVPMATPCVLAVGRTFTRSTVRARVRGVGPGVVRISGRGVKTTRRKLRRATVATVTAKLTAQGRRMRRAKRDVRLRVAFQPTGATKPRVIYTKKRKR